MGLFSRRCFRVLFSDGVFVGVLRQNAVSETLSGIAGKVMMRVLKVSIVRKRRLEAFKKLLSSEKNILKAK